MKTKTFAVLFAAVLLCLVGCRRSMSDYPLSNLRAISSFSIETYHNTAANIYTVHSGVIDERNKTIVVDLPADADFSRLRPTIELSPWATVYPASLQMVDFSDGDSLDYEVTAQSGKTAVYTVYLTRNFIYSDAEIYGIYLNEVLDYNGDPRYCKFSTEESSIYLPSDQPLTAIKTHVDLSYPSHHATIEVDETGVGDAYHAFENDSPLDFSSLKLLFRVTAESGRKKVFTLNVSLITPSV